MGNQSLEGARSMEERISKSQKKRDATALQKIGTNLIALTPAMLDKIPMPEYLRQAIDDAKVIKSHEGKRRQDQLIGKLIRSADHEEILKAYNLIIAGDRAQTDEFKKLESLRDNLVNDCPKALGEFMQNNPSCDEQILRQLIKSAVDEKNIGKPKGAGRALFRFLKAQILPVKNSFI